MRDHGRIRYGTPPRTRTSRKLLALLVAVAAGAALWVFLDSRPRGARVVVVGDSITFGLADNLPGVFGNRYRTEVRAQPGARIDQMLGQLEDLVRDDPHDVIVNLGTNDADQARARPDWRAGFAFMTAVLEPVPCVVFVTVSTRIDELRGGTVARDINVALMRAAAEHPNFHVLDWDALVRAPGGESLLGDDGIHLSDKGRLVLADRFAQALETDCHPGS